MRGGGRCSRSTCYRASASRGATPRDGRTRPRPGGLHLQRGWCAAADQHGALWRDQGRAAGGLAGTRAGSRRNGVTVNCVLAGPTMSDGVLAMWDDIYPGLSRDQQEARFVKEGRAAGSLLGRVIRPEEIAHLVTYLSSDFASATTGRALGADGGLVPTIIP